MGYKAFFFKLWHDNGLISYYDKWCMEYAYEYKNMDYLAKARIAFYVEHGTDEVRRADYEEILNDANAPLEKFKSLADEFMPKITAVINIEYETKRKFYYYSDKFIEHFKVDWHREGVVPEALKTIYRIIDNKRVFLDYLTSKTLAFYNGKDKDGNPKYLAWWERLRNTKLGGIETDEKLMRDYAYEMDKKAVQKRAINAVASSAVYDDKLKTGFVADLSDFLADISDNQSHKIGFYFTDKLGNSIYDLSGELVRKYSVTKAKKEMLLKNRKRKHVQKLKNEQGE